MSDQMNTDWRPTTGYLFTLLMNELIYWPCLVPWSGNSRNCRKMLSSNHWTAREFLDELNLDRKKNLIGKACEHCLFAIGLYILFHKKDK